MKERVVLFRRYAVIVLLLSVLLVSSCSDDNDPKRNDNHFTLDDVKKSISSAVLFYDAAPMNNDVTGETFYRNDLILYSGLELVEEEDGEIELVGEGNAVVFQINSSSQALEEGTYTWTGTEEDPAVFDFWDGAVYLSFNPETEQGETWSFVGGEIHVSKSGDTYTIELTGTINADLDHDGIFNEVDVTASYKGKVTHTLN